MSGPDAATAAPPGCADVAVDSPGRDAYTYRVPDELRGELRVGDCVEVSYGRRRVRGFVLALHDAPPEGVRLKPIGARRDGVRLPAHVLELVRWGARYYRCHLGSFLAAAVPAPVREGTLIRPERRVVAVPGFAGSLTERQREVLAVLGDGDLEPAALARLAGCSASVVAALVEKGAARVEERREIREVHLASDEERHRPTAEQAAALAAVGEALDAGIHETFLLYGVTGSGKTLVYLELAERVIAAGGQVLVLLPEIGLTPQLAARFRRRFARVAIWHSAFSDGERSQQWRAVADGDVDLVIGTRSALFAPLEHPGLIVIDEEQDQSFKQDQAPRYHGRDLAVVYACQLGVPLVMGSATPSLESYRNAVEGRYRILTLRERPGDAVLPAARVVDMGEECRRAGRFVQVSTPLREALVEVRARGEQAIVLLNRRGWAPIVQCLSCGTALRCTACDIGLTWHRGEGMLRCHYCNHREGMPGRCPACGRPDLSAKGLGTEQLEVLLRDAVPGLRTLRLDADTVARRQGHARLLRRFADGGVDCLVGTQMVAKGLDFPSVTLVGIVGADRALSMPDFRAAERCFQLIAQVSGRAGRGERPGRVVVQTFDVDAPAIACAVAGRPKTFYREELALREEHGYPPACGLLRLLWTGADPARVERAAHAGTERCRAHGAGAAVLGPAPAAMAMLKGKVRWNALVKAGSRGAIQRLLDGVAAGGGFPTVSGVHLAIDVDPYTTM